MFINLVMRKDSSLHKTLPTTKLRNLENFCIIKSLLMARGFLNLHKATFKKIDDFLISLHCQASQFADGLWQELMMKLSRLGRKPEGAITCEYFL